MIKQELGSRVVWSKKKVVCVF